MPLINLISSLSAKEMNGFITAQNNPFLCLCRFYDAAVTKNLPNAEIPISCKSESANRTTLRAREEGGREGGERERERGDK